MLSETVLPDMLPRPPAISLAEYRQRRDTLMAQLPDNAAGQRVCLSSEQ